MATRSNGNETVSICSTCRYVPRVDRATQCVMNRHLAEVMNIQGYNIPYLHTVHTAEAISRVHGRALLAGGLLLAEQTHHLISSMIDD